jgi:hypothetical protein
MCSCTPYLRPTQPGEGDSLIVTRRFVAGLVFAVGAPAIASAQARPDSTKPDTAQRLPAATVREAPENLPQAYLRRSRIRGTGKFLTAKQIEQLNPPHTPQLLARVSGGDIRDIGGGNSAIVGNRGTSMSMLGSVPNQLCVIGIAVNDVRVPAGFDIKAIRIEDIAAIEFYNGPSSIPLELGGTHSTDANCGLFVIWLKERRRQR